LKRKRPVLYSPFMGFMKSVMKWRMKRGKLGSDRRAFLYKNCSIRYGARIARQTEANVNEGEMLLERCT
jgi:hypothetical protein